MYNNFTIIFFNSADDFYRKVCCSLKTMANGYFYIQIYK
ncbi:hypothetical protein CLOL250_02393 [Clostridium sp. L2-50]|nr:hypothetical protein CLOL250_02393 [Clostridium sp. L2-50]